jgi:predicted dehydrogenase
MSEKKTVRIGFVGTGAMGQCAHLRNYVTVPDCEVAAIAEIRPKLAEKVAAKYGIPKVYPDHRAMLEAEELDGIVASQYFGLHSILVPELLEYGAPVFTEKPLAGTIEGAKKILAALEKSRSWLMIGYHKRSDPATMYAKAEIERLKQSGELGALRYIRLTMPPGDWIASGFTELITSDEPVPPLEMEPPASDMDEATFQEYTAFVNYYIHQINLLRHLFGEDYSMTHADRSGALLVAESESGVTGIIEMAPYNTTIDWQESALIGFEKGCIRLELPAPLALNRPGRAELLRDPGEGVTPETVVPALPWIHAMRQQAMNFVAAIRGKMEAPCLAQEAIKDLEVARDYIRKRFGK